MSARLASSPQNLPLIRPNACLASSLLSATRNPHEGHGIFPRGPSGHIPPQLHTCPQPGPATSRAPLPARRLLLWPLLASLPAQTKPLPGAPSPPPTFLPAGWLSSTLPLGCGWPRGALLGLLPDSTGERLPSPGTASPRLPPRRAVSTLTGLQWPVSPRGRALRGWRPLASRLGSERWSQPAGWVPLGRSLYVWGPHSLFCKVGVMIACQKDAVFGESPTALTAEARCESADRTQMGKPEEGSSPAPWHLAAVGGG